MRIEIRVGSNVSPDTGALLHRRLEFALGRFGGRVRLVRGRLVDVNGPDGGVDKLCRIAIRLERAGPPIVVEDIDADPLVAAGRAADRAARVVARALERSSIR